MGKFRTSTQIFREFYLFLREDRTWWLAPIVIVLAGAAVFVTFTQGSALAPLIYALF